MKTTNNIDYDSIRKTAAAIVAGSQRIYRLIPEGEKGRIAGGIRNVEASCLLGTEENTDLSDTSERQSLMQEHLLEKYAKHENMKTFGLSMKQSRENGIVLIQGKVQKPKSTRMKINLLSGKFFII
ncbi:MAG: hypothetical protein LBG77_07345 [Dysgonamonadaceae bacterium]|jgi:hypothetical protein|nr:hypothetical protein [Dysgonamonadaceae bacterium]